MNLVHRLAERAGKHPEKIALADKGTSITYGKLYRHVCGASQQLHADGLRQGDTVLILQPVGIPLYISLLGAFHAGLTVMFIDPSAGKKTLRNCLRLHPPSAMIGSGKAHWLRLTVPEIRNIPHLYHSSGRVPFSRKWQPAHATTLHPPSPATGDSPALITFTSGSTGMPKAACRTHGFLLAQHKALASSLDHTEGEVDLVTLPIFTLANMASGITSVLANTDLRFPARADSAAIAEQCRRHRVTRCAASPAFFDKLLRDGQLPAFKAIYTGGAPVFPRLLSQIHSTSPDTDVVTVFGSTEAEPISHIRWQDTSAQDRQDMSAGKGLLVGTPASATRLKIIPDHTGQKIGPLPPSAFDAMELPPGETGEIAVTGEHVLKSYLNGKGNEESKITVGNTVWHRTGDAAWRDNSGRIWLVGRCTAAIKRPGQPTLYPFGIECAAMDHPKVRRCAMTLHHGQACLFIEGNITPTDTSNLLKKLSPMGVETIKSIPKIPVDKRHNAKIDYPSLHKLTTKA